MSFQPILPLGGFAGWAFLQRTETAQREAFERAPQMDRETRYFEEKIQSVQTAAELVADGTLMKVALGAFGLEDDLPNKAFVQKVLEGGILDEDSLANRLSDQRYFEMAKAFGFDLGTPSTQISTFASEIVAQFKERQFEAAVGAQNEDMRLALGLKRDLVEVAKGTASEDSKWFQIMGTPSLRAVFETALGLPSSFGAIDLDQQLQVFKERSEAAFGNSTITQFSDDEKQGELIRRFFALGSISDTGFSTSSGASAALSLLQASPVAPLT